MSALTPPWSASVVAAATSAVAASAGIPRRSLFPTARRGRPPSLSPVLPPCRPRREWRASRPAFPRLVGCGWRGGVGRGRGLGDRGVAWRGAAPLRRQPRLSGSRPGQRRSVPPSTTDGWAGGRAAVAAAAPQPAGPALLPRQRPASAAPRTGPQRAAPRVVSPDREVPPDQRRRSHPTSVLRWQPRRAAQRSGYPSRPWRRGGARPGANGSGGSGGGGRGGSGCGGGSVRRRQRRARAAAAGEGGAPHGPRMM